MFCFPFTTLGVLEKLRNVRLSIAASSNAKIALVSVGVSEWPKLATALSLVFGSSDIAVWILIHVQMREQRRKQAQETEEMWQKASIQTTP